MTSKNNPHNIVVGQKLYYVPNRHNSSGAPRNVVVERVGKKWITCNDCARLDIDTLCGDGGKYSSPGSCYLTKNHYDELVMLGSMWSDVQQLFKSTYSRPYHITKQDMIDITAIMERGK